MSTAKFTTIGFPIDTLLGQIETGQIGLPELQRPFVWDRAQVRDLIDSLYRGFPAGHFLLWETKADAATAPIGADPKQTSPSLVVVDGQQRLTSLYAVFRAAPVFTEKFEEVHIRISFNPLRERFEVLNSAIANDSEWIPDISPLLSGKQNAFSLVTEFIEVLGQDRELSPDQRDRIATNLQRLASLGTYRFEAVQLAHSVEIGEVSEIFVRVNSKGTQLSQADFILTLMSVHWDKGRKQLEEFCRAAKQPSSAASPFNNFIEPAPDQLLRVSVGLAHDRAVLKYAYELLRGKNLKTKEISDELRKENFEKLKDAQQEVLDLTNWHEYLKALQEAGFRSGKMITSKNTIVFAYLIFLIGRRDYGLDYTTLRSAVARWFFMCVLTSRYTGSAETQVEKDLRMFASATTGDEFLNILDRAIATSLTDDYWTVTLPDLLKWSGGFIPAMFAYYAALNLLGAKVLFSNLTVHELLDPTHVGKKSPIERHHLFPKKYLKSIGIDKPAMINQVANFALVEWPKNIAIGADAPDTYFPSLFEQIPEHERAAVRRLHALPDGWEAMEYQEFLEARRPMLAQVIRDGFTKLSQGHLPADLLPAPTVLSPVSELVEGGESLTVEFKSSVWHSYKPDVPEKIIVGSIIKTLAAFLNTDGGSLVIGVDDDGNALGLQPDFDRKKLDADGFENAVTSIAISALGEVATKRCKMRFAEFDGTTVAIIDVDRSPKPVYADTDKGKGIFYSRIANTTRIVAGEELVSYVADQWGLT